jgi:hypothetical protein
MCRERKERERMVQEGEREGEARGGEGERDEEDGHPYI